MVAFSASRLFGHEPHLELTVSAALAVSPISGSSWEGVALDVPVAAEKVLEACLRGIRQDRSARESSDV
jgi:hypothetical protein